LNLLSKTPDHTDKCLEMTASGVNRISMPLTTVKYIRVRRGVAEFARRFDKAISLGVAAAYPLLFSMQSPDPLPDWKAGIRFGWRIVRVSARETIKILKKGLP
jgi:hypothetical protein